MAEEKDPAFLFYSQDFYVDTALWDDDELGRYIRMLCIQHMNGPFDPADFEKLTLSNDLKIRSKFIQNDQGQFYNNKMEEVREKRQEFLDKQRINGKKGGRPKKPNKTQRLTQTITQMKPNDNPTANPNHNPNETTRVENENKYLSTLVVKDLDLKEVLKDNGQIESLTDTPFVQSDNGHDEPKAKEPKVPKFFYKYDKADDAHPFNVFWNEYPRRVKKKEAMTKFEKNVTDWETVKAIIVDIQSRLKMGIWQTQEIQYVPHPSTYLHGLMWEDELVAPGVVKKPTVSQQPIVRAEIKMPEYSQDDSIEGSVEDYKKEIEEMLNGGNSNDE